MTTAYEDLNNLDDTSFIAGTQFYMTFNVFDDAGLPINIIASTNKVVLAYYGQPDYTVLTKNGTITGLNTFVVTFLPADTIGLSGKFVFQAVTIDSAGVVNRPGQGVLTLIPGIVYT